MAVAAQLAQLRKEGAAVVRVGENTEAAEAALAQISSRCVVGWAQGRLAVLTADESARLAGAVAFALPDPPAALLLTFIARHAPSTHSAVLLAAVAFHETPLFARLVKQLGNALAGTPWAFLMGLPPAGVARAALVQRAARDGGQLAALLLDHARASLAQQRLAPAFVRFYAAFFAELLAVLPAALLRDTYTALLLPYALSAVRAAPHLDLQLAGGMHFALLHARSPLPAATVARFVAEFLRTASAAPQARDAALLTLVLLDAPLPAEAVAFFAAWPRAPVALERPAAAPLLRRLVHLALAAALASPPLPQALPLLRSLLARPALRSSELLAALLARLHELYAASPRPATLPAVARDLLAVLPPHTLTQAVQRLVHSLSPSAAERPALLAFLAAVAPPAAPALALPLFLSLHHADAAVRALAWAQLDAALSSGGDADAAREAGAWLDTALAEHDQRVLVAALSATHAAPLASPAAVAALLAAPHTTTLLLSAPDVATALLERFLPARPALALAALLPPLLPLLFSALPHAAAARRLLAAHVPALAEARKRRAGHAGEKDKDAEHTLQLLAAALSPPVVAALEARPSPVALLLLSAASPPPLPALHRVAAALLPTARKSKHAPLAQGLDAALAAIQAACVASPSRKAVRAAAAAAVAHAAAVVAPDAAFQRPLLGLALAARPSPLSRALLHALVSHASLAQLAALAAPPDPRPVLSLLSAHVAAKPAASLDALLPPLLAALTSPRAAHRRAALALAAQAATHASGALQSVAQAVLKEEAELRAESAALEARAATWLALLEPATLARLLPVLVAAPHPAYRARLVRVVGALLAAHPPALRSLVRSAHDPSALAALLPHLAPLWSQPAPAADLVAALAAAPAASSPAALAAALTPDALALVAPAAAAPVFDLVAAALAAAPAASRPALRALLVAVPLPPAAWAERLAPAAPHASLLVELLPDALRARPAALASAALVAPLLQLCTRLAPPASPFAAQAALAAVAHVAEAAPERERKALSKALDGAAPAVLCLLDAWPAEPALQLHAAQLAAHAAAAVAAHAPVAALLDGLVARLDSPHALRLLLAALLPRAPAPAAAAALRSLLARLPDQRAALLAAAQHALAPAAAHLPFLALAADPLLPAAALAADADEAHLAAAGAALAAGLAPDAALSALLAALADAAGVARVRLLRVLQAAAPHLEGADGAALSTLLQTLLSAPDAPRTALGKAESAALSAALDRLQEAQRGAPLLAALRQLLVPRAAADAPALSATARRRALHLLNERCAALAAGADAAPILALLPALVAVLNDKRAPAAAQLTALHTVEVLVRMLGARAPHAFETLLPALVAHLRHPAPHSAAAAALALGSYAAALGVRLLAQLPVVFPALLAALTAPDAAPGSVAHLALLSAAQVLVARLSAFVGPYLAPLLALLSADPLRRAAASAAPLAERLAQLEAQLISSVAPRVLLPALFASYAPDAPLATRTHLLGVLQRAVEGVAKEELVAQHKLALKFFLRTLAPDVADAAGAALLALVLRLNEAQFKPLFLQLLEWAALLAPERPPLTDRVRVLYHLAALFASRLRALFVPYTGYLLDDALARLAASADRAARLPPPVWADVLALLRDALAHDASGFFDKPRFDLLAAALVPQLELAAHADYAVAEHVVPALSQLGAAMASDALWKGLNSAVLLKTRSKSAPVRIAALAALDALFSRLGEEYLILVPESVPYLSELLEDPSAEVEARCQRLIATIDGLMGGTGSVREFFQR